MVICLSIAAMEAIAIISHKYIMHGPGWFLHKSHHIKHKNNFESNDYYFLFFSTPSIISIVLGLLYSNNIILSIGICVLCYGLIYIFLHDIRVHKRFGLSININISYFRKIKKSHLKHHSIKTKHGASNFGFITYK